MRVIVGKNVYIQAAEGKMLKVRMREFASTMEEHLRKGKQRREVESEKHRGVIFVEWEGYSPENVMEKIGRFIKRVAWKEYALDVKPLRLNYRNQFYNLGSEFLLYEDDPSNSHLKVVFDIRGKFGGEFYLVEIHITEA